MPSLTIASPCSKPNNGGPSWSQDGEWIYFYSDRTGGHFQIWKVPVNGGSPAQVTRNGGVFAAAESADGRFLYYSKYEVPGIWKMALHGGEETRILDQPGRWDWADWALVRNGIYFLIDETPGYKTDIEFFEFATGKKIPIASLDKAANFGLAVSPDGRSILFVPNELSESSIMLVKNFR